MIFYFLNLGFPPTKQVAVLTDYLILCLSGMSKPGFVIVFAVALITLAAEELKELLGQLRTSNLSIMLIPEQRF